MEKEYEIVASFKENNCTFTIKQPIQNSSAEELKTFYAALAKATFKQQNKP